MNTEKQRLSSLSLLGKRAFKSTLQNNKLKLNSINTRIISGISRIMKKANENIGITQKKLFSLTRNTIRKENIRLGGFENTVKLLDPSLVLKRGYTMTFLNGNLIKSVSQIKPGDVIENTWNDGTSVSTISSAKKKDVEGREWT
jgi:exodeoxyribonuclease VII large subunit